MTDPIAALWVQQHRDAAAPDPAALATAEARLRARLRRRDIVEYAAGMLAAGAFAHTGLQAQDWGVRIACVAIIIGTAVVMHNLWQRRPREPQAYEAPGIAFYRAQLVAQRDALASVWRWYLGPVVPGLALFVVTSAFAGSEHMPLWAALLAMAIGGGLIGGVFWGIHRLNRAAARRIQRSIDALDRGEVEN